MLRKTALILLSLYVAANRAFATDVFPSWPEPIVAPRGAPNIVVILLDDAGFAATSTFGGAVQTPELSKLAAQGVSYNRFHVASSCSPTRAALLSGRNPHVMGFGTVANDPNGFPGHNSVWKKSTAMVADVLKRNGYSTAAFGKWHNTPYWEISPVGPFDRWPTGLGFEYFYGEMNGLTHQWRPLIYRNTTLVRPPAPLAPGYHFTTDIVSEAVQWVHTQQSLAPGKPYFLYMATNATHGPLQAPREWIARYRGQFDGGWDQLREETFARQKKLGVIPADAKLTARPKDIPAWSSLSADQKKLSARQMEVFAGYLAHTDHELGRLLQAVREDPNGDNTIVFYVTGDNGGDLVGGMAGADAPDLPERLKRLDELGGDSLSDFYTVAAGWGWAMNTPFQGGKFVSSHLGGTRNPLVVSWPAGIKDRGGLRSQYTHVIDVVPTVYEVAGITVPSVVDGVEQRPLDGISFAYSFQDAGAPSRRRAQIFEQSGNRSIYQDGWVAGAFHSVPGASSPPRSFDEDRWELYHLDEDFTQADDLAARYPQKLRELRALFDTEARKNDIYPLLEYGGDPHSAPSPARGRKQFVFYPDLPPIATNLNPPMGLVLPDFGQSHRITAEVAIPREGADGVIVAQSAAFGMGGFALYVKNGRLVYESNAGAQPVAITSPQPLPPGEVKLAFEFVRGNVDGTTGTARLFVNGQPAGEGRAASRSVGGVFSVNRAFDSPPSGAFTPPFQFGGTLKKIVVDMK